MMRVIWSVVASLALVGCASVPAVPVPAPVKVAVAVGCLGEIPARPINTFNRGIYPGDSAAAKAALIDAAAWEGYALSLEVAQAGCEKKPRAPMQ
ncbi:hypothetical protein GTP38_23385 [Duganella sp. FT94W]|uniref:Lipoprotein n=1 Tax=Duganella lactea TaxID=2692173 RepID=A0ABW9VCC0_9BURK|nr:hypothetical protein [Duganella lactea]MYM37274.1 hypothetical protein [Duganella lactea]